MLCFNFSDEGVRSVTPIPVFREFAPVLTSFMESDSGRYVSIKPLVVSIAVPFFENAKGLVMGESNLTRLLEL